MINEYCKICRKYSVGDMECREISGFNYTSEPLCFEPREKLNKG